MAGSEPPALIHLDTHVVCWLYAGEVERLSPTARRLLESTPLAISPMVELEIQSLKEIGRFRDSPAQVLGVLANDLGLTVSQTPFPLVVTAAQQLNWTRDVFDRLITAQAQVDGAALVTKDERIRQHFAEALW